MNTAQAKSRLRARLKRERARHLPESEHLCADVLERLSPLNARTLAVYAALPGEVDVAPLVDRWLAEGRTVLYPRVTGRTTMELADVTRREDLRASKLGILEPVGPAWTGSVEAFLLPGLAFDGLGGRLGFGAGYYDRFLLLHPTACRIGVAFDWQVVSHVPMDLHDLRADLVITDRRIYRGGLAHRALKELGCIPTRS